jgi:prolyl-tRNA synthetase
MMGDTRALQSGTSHNLGQHFAKAFDIQYLDRNNELQHCWTTSWGLSTRFVGAIIMTHGDDQGLILPPRLAPIQVVIVPIYKNDDEKAAVMPVAEKVEKALSAFRVKLDAREEMTPGFKFNDWELRGVPLRIEIGPKDVEKEAVMLARRDIPGRDGKTSVALAGLAEKVADLLVEIQAALLQRATDFREAHTSEPADYAELQQIVQDGWALAHWCGSAECEARVKEDTKATLRNIPFDMQDSGGKCIVCGKPATDKVIFSKAY